MGNGGAVVISACESFSSLRMDVCMVCEWVRVQHMRAAALLGFMPDSFLKSSENDSHLGLNVHRREPTSCHANSAFRFHRWSFALSLQVREVHLS